MYLQSPRTGVCSVALLLHTTKPFHSSANCERWNAKHWRGAPLPKYLEIILPFRKVHSNHISWWQVHLMHLDIPTTVILTYEHTNVCCMVECIHMYYWDLTLCLPVYWTFWRIPEYLMYFASHEIFITRIFACLLFSAVPALLVGLFKHVSLAPPHTVTYLPKVLLYSSPELENQQSY